jgi:ubiquinone/menaquinone biosynthesis C-methylase UbiE
MAIFRKGLPVHHTALAMVGAKAGQQVLVAGAGDVKLAAEIALITGLNGRTVVVDRGPDVAGRVEAAAAHAGALIEFVDAPLAMLPLDDASFDLAVVAAGLAARADDARRAIVGEAVRVVRPGGRVVLIEGARRAGLFGALRATSPALDEADARALLTRADTTAVRVLAHAEGVAFYEARKSVPRATAT